jgi:hypothetical protein
MKKTLQDVLMPLGLILPKIIILDQQWIDHLKLQKKWR